MTLRWFTAILLVAMASMVAAVPALAHAALIASDPADGARLDDSPARITLTFNQDIEPQFAVVTVSGPDGTAYATGDVRVDGSAVVLDVKPLGPAATYAVAYRVISADGHPISGQYAFDLTDAAPAVTSSAAATPSTSAAAPTAAPTAPDDQGFPVWVVVAATTAVMAGLALVMVRRRG